MCSSDLLQALPLGRVVDDFAAVQVDPTAWTRAMIAAISVLAFD